MDTPTELLPTFESRLKRWRREAWSGDTFYDVQAIEQWMQDGYDESRSNAGKLLQELGPLMADRQFAGFHVEQILLQPKRSLRVFAVLLSHGNGELIDIFRETNIVDDVLGRLDDEDYNELLDKLTSKGIPNHLEVIKRFKRDIWSFCPAQIRLRMDDSYSRGAMIVPFCRKQRVNKKGGTAAVYEVLVQEDFVPDDLRAVLGKSQHQDQTFGQCYRMALKTFREEYVEDFEREQRALRSLDDLHPGVGLVKYLGYFHHFERSTVLERTNDNGDVDDRLEAGRSQTTDPNPTFPIRNHAVINHSNFGSRNKTYNILMEYGQLDLDEYFAETAPPESYEEISQFWRKLFRLAEALTIVHDPVTNETRHFHGWHGDVKPDNILFIDEQFKLADFGFATFKQSDGGIPKSKMQGGTQTYGAPEQHAAWSNGMIDELPRAIDVWALGTVLLTAATWVVLGLKGIERFELVRKVAVAKIRESQPSRTLLKDCDDPFHDGSHPLPEIKNWSRHLTDRMRKCDLLTSEVLDLVRNHMLLADHRDRSTCKQIKDKLDGLLRNAETEHQNLLSKQELHDDLTSFDTATLKAFLAHERTVVDLQSVEKRKTKFLTIDDTSGEIRMSLSIPLDRSTRKSRRLGKSQRLEKRQMTKTSSCEEILKNQLNGKGLDIPVITEDLIDDSDSSEQTPNHKDKRLQRYSSLKTDITYQSKPSGVGSDAVGRRDDATSPITRMGDSSLRLDNPTTNQRLHSALSSPRSSNSGFDQSLYRHRHEAIDRLCGLGFGRSLVIDVYKACNYEEERAADCLLDWTRIQPIADDTLSDDNARPRLMQDPQIPRNYYFAVPPNTRPPQASFGNPARTESLPLSHLQPSPNGSLIHTSPAIRTTPNTPVSQVSQNQELEVTQAQSPSNGASYSSVGLGLPEVLRPRLSSSRNLNSIEEYEAFPHTSAFTAGRSPGENFTKSGLTTNINSANVTPSHKQSSSSPPTNIRDVKFDLIHTRLSLDHEATKRRFDKLNLFSRPKADEHLKNFIIDRDLVFVVDNGSSTRKYKHLAAFAVETLAMKARSLDPDGIDLRFTIGPNEVSKAKNDAPLKFKEATLSAWPESRPRSVTDMSATLAKLIQEYFSKYPYNARTLIVLTDGLWLTESESEGTAATKDEYVESVLINTLYRRLLAKNLYTPRWFTIQFIQLGEDLNAASKLRRLDDDLPTIASEQGVSMTDSIDHVHWTGAVNKMFLGSVCNSDDPDPASAEGGPSFPLPQVSPPSNIDNLCAEYYNPASAPKYSLRSLSLSSRKVKT